MLHTQDQENDCLHLAACTKQLGRPPHDKYECLSCNNNEPNDEINLYNKAVNLTKAVTKNTLTAQVANNRKLLSNWNCRMDRYLHGKAIDLTASINSRIDYAAKMEKAKMKEFSQFGNRQLESIGKFRFIRNLNYTKRAKYLFLREQGYSYGIIAKFFHSTPSKIWKSVNSKSKMSAGTQFALECLNRLNDPDLLSYYKGTAIYLYLVALHGPVLESTRKDS